MTYLRAFFLNFLIVFFVDRVMPGVEISNYEAVPNIGADILFSLVLGFLNTSVFFAWALLEAPITHLKLAVPTFIISFGGFLLIAIFPFGVQVVNAGGVIFGGGLVWLVAYLTNYLEWSFIKKSGSGPL